MVPVVASLRVEEAALVVFLQDLPWVVTPEEVRVQNRDLPVREVVVEEAPVHDSLVVEERSFGPGTAEGRQTWGLVCLVWPVCLVSRPSVSWVVSEAVVGLV